MTEGFSCARRQIEPEWKAGASPDASLVGPEEEGRVFDTGQAAFCEGSIGDFSGPGFAVIGIGSFAPSTRP